MTYVVKCDKDGCDIERDLEQGLMKLDPWVQVECDLFRPKKLHFCGVQHAADGILEQRTRRSVRED